MPHAKDKMNQRPLDHHIQREIIVRLSMADALRFSELKPTNLENNHFMYHLNLLAKDGLVQKAGGLYRLAPAGLTYVDRLSYKNRRPRHQPKLIALIAIVNGKGEYLLAKRKVQPFFGYSMLVSGKQHFGEKPNQHAVRELAEKTGLKVALRSRGFANILIYQADDLISHLAAYVFSGTADRGRLRQNDERFELFWQSPDNLEEVTLLPGTLEIIELINNDNKKFFFESLEYQLP